LRKERKKADWVSGHFGQGKGGGGKKTFVGKVTTADETGEVEKTLKVPLGCRREQMKKAADYQGRGE